MVIAPDQFNSLMNVVQTVLLAWIAQCDTRRLRVRQTRRMQRNGSNTHE